jgi:hypothetical protein
MTSSSGPTRLDALRHMWSRHEAGLVGYGRSMSHMADHERPVEIEDVPEGEGIAPGDVAERVDEEPEKQANRRDPVWHDDEVED